MKTTGSIRVNICHEENDRYWVTIPLEGGQESEKYCVSPSAVTDIHEEMDWTYNDLIAVWNYDREKKDAMIGFYRRHVNKKVGVAWTKTASGVEDYCDNALPLDQWLKEHGNKEDGE